MATKEDLQAQLKMLEAEETELKKQKTSNEKNFIKSKMYNGTKWMIIIVIVVLVLIGTLGSMHVGPFSSFDMTDFTSFLGSFSPIFITLTSSIGLGGIAKNVVKGITAAKENIAQAEEDLGEDFARGGV